MNYNKSFLALFFLICLGSFNAEHGTQAAIAKTYATSRSLLTNGFNSWMEITTPYRTAANYIGAGISGTLLLKYFYHAIQLKHYKKLEHARRANKSRTFLIGSTLAWLIAAPSWTTGAATILACLLPKFPDGGSCGGAAALQYAPQQL